MTAKFTKGPWQVFMGGASVGNSNGLGIAALWSDGDELEANAALIACAPEMYEMLETILQVFEMDHRTTTDVISLLEKARGEA
jgi:hypothetical protein